MYFGGKAKISKVLCEFLNDELKINQPFVDLFCGSCNVISKINPDRIRIANDLHYELISMWIYLQNGGVLPDNISESEYADIKYNGEPWLKSFVGFGCSFAGKYFGGYARDDIGRNYCRNAKNSTMRKVSLLNNVDFKNQHYSLCEIPDNSLVYCDIPYKNSTSYSVGCFNHEDFYKYAVELNNAGHDVYVSEYKHNVPVSWSIVWEHRSKKDIRNKNNELEQTIEVLMTPKPHILKHKPINLDSVFD